MCRSYAPKLPTPAKTKCSLVHSRFTQHKPCPSSFPLRWGQGNKQKRKPDGIKQGVDNNRTRRKTKAFIKETVELNEVPRNRWILAGLSNVSNFVPIKTLDIVLFHKGFNVFLDIRDLGRETRLDDLNDFLYQLYVSHLLS